MRRIGVLGRLLSSCEVEKVLGEDKGSDWASGLLCEGFKVVEEDNNTRSHANLACVWGRMKTLERSCLPCVEHESGVEGPYCNY